MPCAFAARPLTEAVETLRASSPFPIELERELPSEVLAAPVSLDEAGLDLETALSRVAGAAGLGWALDAARILVGTPERLPPVPEALRIQRCLAQLARDGHGEEWEKPAGLEANAALRARLVSVTLDVSFRQAPLTEALAHFRGAGGVAIQLAPGAAGQADAPVTVELRQRPLGIALRAVVEAVGLDFDVREGRLLVDFRSGLEASAARDAKERSARSERLRAFLAQPITVDWREKPLREAAAELSRTLGVPVVLDEEAWLRETRVTLLARELDLRSTLDLLARNSRTAWGVLEGRVGLVAR